MNKQEDIKKAKKILDANDDIGKIEERLHDSTLFHRKADHLYDELSKKIDYLPYIELGKTANRMNGDIPFKNLNYKYKLNVFRMIRNAILEYIAYETCKKEESENEGNQ